MIVSCDILIGDVEVLSKNFSGGVLHPFKSDLRGKLNTFSSHIPSEGYNVNSKAKMLNIVAFFIFMFPIIKITAQLLDRILYIIILVTYCQIIFLIINRGVLSIKIYPGGVSSNNPGFGVKITTD